MFIQQEWSAPRNKMWECLKPKKREWIRLAEWPEDLLKAQSSNDTEQYL